MFGDKPVDSALERIDERERSMAQRAVTESETGRMLTESLRRRLGPPAESSGEL